MSTSVGSMPRTPSIVFNSTGNRQKNAMNATFWRFPIECRRTTEIGSSAGGGIARHHSMCGIASIRPHRESPSGMPSSTPRTTAIPNPSRILVRLGTRWSSTWENSHISRNSTRIVERRGNIGSLALGGPDLPGRRGSRPARRSPPRSPTRGRAASRSRARLPLGGVPTQSPAARALRRRRRSPARGTPWRARSRTPGP